MDEGDVLGAEGSALEVLDVGGVAIAVEKVLLASGCKFLEFNKLKTFVNQVKWRINQPHTFHRLWLGPWLEHLADLPLLQCVVLLQYLLVQPVRMADAGDGVGDTLWKNAQ